MGFRELKEELESAACKLGWGRGQRPVGARGWGELKEKAGWVSAVWAASCHPQPRHIEKVGLVEVGRPQGYGLEAAWKLCLPVAALRGQWLLLTHFSSCEHQHVGAGDVDQ